MNIKFRFVKWHEFFHEITTYPTFRIAWFFFFPSSSILPYYLTTFPLKFLLHVGLSECDLWVLPVPFWRNVSFSAFLPLQLQDASYTLSPSVFIKVLSVTSCFFLLFKFISNHSLHSPHVPFCLLSHNNQHFDFFSVLVFPWWREYDNLFLWFYRFEWHKLQIDFLIF